MFEIVEADSSHIAPIAGNMRPIDKLECMALSGTGPFESLEEALAISQLAYTVLKDGKPIAMGGVAGAGDIGSVWILASEDFYSFRKEMLRLTPKYLRLFHSKYPLLFNYVYAGNEKAIRWLKWAGFSFVQQIQNFGYLQIPVYEFVRIEHVQPGPSHDGCLHGCYSNGQLLPVSSPE